MAMVETRNSGARVAVLLSLPCRDRSCSCSRADPCLEGKASGVQAGGSCHRTRLSRENVLRKIGGRWDLISRFPRHAAQKRTAPCIICAKQLRGHQFRGSQRPARLPVTSHQFIPLTVAIAKIPISTRERFWSKSHFLEQSSPHLCRLDYATHQHNISVDAQGPSAVPCGRKPACDDCRRRV